MHTVKTIFDGEKVVVPEELRGSPPRQVVLVFEDDPTNGDDTRAWMEAQEATLRRVWDNDEDAVYDAL